ncbi:hypothetical protein NIO33_004051 [Salmonella enterica]|nr:hypothetical protein [Salmonella enterica]
MTFSLSYELLLQETEDQIKKCNLREAGPYYLQELNKARDFLAFWHRLALKGHRHVEGHFAMMHLSVRQFSPDSNTGEPVRKSVCFQLYVRALP